MLILKKWSIRRITYFLQQEFEDNYVGNIDQQLTEMICNKCGRGIGFVYEFVQLLKQLEPIRGESIRYKLCFTNEIVSKLESLTSSMPNQMPIQIPIPTPPEYGQIVCHI